MQCKISAMDYPELLFAGIMSLITFVMYGLDKFYAIRNMRRTPESALLMLALLGGALGALCGMRLFRHKTKHLKFVICVPLFLFLQIAAELCYRVM